MIDKKHTNITAMRIFVEIDVAKLPPTSTVSRTQFHTQAVSLTRPLTHSPTHPLTHLLTTHSHKQSSSLTHPTHSPTHSLTRPLTHSLAHLLTHTPTHPLTHSPTHPLTNTSNLTSAAKSRYACTITSGLEAYLTITDACAARMGRRDKGSDKRNGCGV